MKHAQAQPTVINHPWLQHNLTIVRDTDTASSQRLAAVEQVAGKLLDAATEGMPILKRHIFTPTVDNVQMPILDPLHKIIFVHVMRAGIGFQSAVTRLRQAGFPIKQEIYLEAQRDEDTLDATILACKLPKELNADHVIFGEPMCATGGSTSLALEVALARATKRVQRISCLHFFATEIGLSYVREQHPKVNQICAAIDPKLNELGYIVPGCGDFGDLITGVTPH